MGEAAGKHQVLLLPASPGTEHQFLPPKARTGIAWSRTSHLGNHLVIRPWVSFVIDGK